MVEKMLQVSFYNHSSDMKTWGFLFHRDVYHPTSKLITYTDYYYDKECCSGYTGANCEGIVHVVYILCCL